AQTEILEWLAQMHAEAERSRSARDVNFDAAAFHTRIRKLLYRCGCSPDKIASRGYELADGTHSVWSEMRIYDVVRDPEGAGSQARTELYARAAEVAIDRLFSEEDTAPRDLL